MKILTLVISSSVLALLGGCASMPTGPSMLALPGSGKNFSDFRMDDAQCRQYASQQVGGSANDPAVRNAVIGTVVGTAAGAAIGGHRGAGVGAGAGLLFGSAVGAESSQRYAYGSQRQYDNAYIQCMYSSGHNVPVPAGLARSRMQAPVPNGNYPPPPPYSPPSSPPPDYFPPPAPSR